MQTGKKPLPLPMSANANDSANVCQRKDSTERGEAAGGMMDGGLDREVATPIMGDDDRMKRGCQLVEAA